MYERHQAPWEVLGKKSLGDEILDDLFTWYLSKNMYVYKYMCIYIIIIYVSIYLLIYFCI